MLIKELEIAIEAALAAGRAVVTIYRNEDYQIESKEDNSPLTTADKVANSIINDFLIPTGIPIISEENQQQPYEERKNWKSCWIVDPLDGTKEFLKKNGEFTVNIAFVENGNPKFGVIFAPVLEELYYGTVQDKKAYKASVSPGHYQLTEVLRSAQEMKPTAPEDIIKVVASRSHLNKATLNYIAALQEQYGEKVEIISKGSSLKFCLIAEGLANVYPRFGPTMEWDTAAGQAICAAVGLRCTLQETGKVVTYNRENLLNGHFLVSHER